MVINESPLLLKTHEINEVYHWHSSRFALCFYHVSQEAEFMFYYTLVNKKRNKTKKIIQFPITQPNSSGTDTLVRV